VSVILVIPTGTCNLASVCAAIARSGCSVVLSDRSAEIRTARIVVLPGVGSFRAAMDRLRACGAADAVVRRAEDDRPMLAICVGAQVLAEESEESPGVRGLEIVSGSVRRLGGGMSVRLPQMTWNQTRPDDRCRMLEAGDAYFANSYALHDSPVSGAQPCAVAWSEYGGRFVAGFERGTLLACQCHPELSGAWGRRLFARFIAAHAARRASGVRGGVHAEPS